MWLGYTLFNNYGLSILLFTVLIKVLMSPLSIWTQKNSIKMVRLKPQLNEIEIKHFGDSEKILSEQRVLYKKEKYNPWVSILPLLIQIPIILGLIAVIYNPMQHLLHIPEPVMSAIEVRAEQLAPVGTQLQAVSMIKDPQYAASFDSITVPGQDVQSALSSIRSLDLELWGMDLSATPTASPADPLVWIPFAALLSTLLLSWVQNLLNVLQRESGWLGRWGQAILLSLLSLYLAFAVPAAVGIYWVLGNLLAAVLAIILNKLYNPKKHIDYAALERTKEILSKLKAERKKSKPTAEQKKRSKADYARFLDESVYKRLVFYSEKSGFYKYFKGYIEYILANSDLDIHYITSDPNDAVFQIDEPRLIPYYIDNNRLIILFMKMEADMVAMTMPDIEQFHLKRSRLKKDVEYVYMYHGMTNSLMVGRKNCIAYYDTIFCVGPHQVEEFLEEESLYSIKPRNLLKVGYPFIDELITSYAATEQADHERPQLLIAPSWQDNNIMDSCIDLVIDALKDKHYDIIVRPHPEYVKRYGGKLSEFREKYTNYKNVRLESDFSTNNTIFESDILITDWSTIAYDFAYSTKKPCVFINTPMKVMNPEYTKFKCDNLDIKLRCEVGLSVEIEQIGNLNEVITGLLLKKDDYREKITSIVDKYVYNLGKSAAYGGSYIIEKLKEKRNDS